MPDFSDIKDVQDLLKSAQDAEDDLREQAREAHLFVTKRDGQWESYWWEARKNKPRYTFDQTTPIIEQVSGEIARKDFDIKVKPGNGDTSKADAKVYDGVIRAIENMSDAKRVYNAAAREMITGGLDGWHVVQEFVDDNSFNQDLLIKPIANFVDSVWFDPNAKMQDMSDAKYCFVLEAITKKDYEYKYPDASGQSVSQNRDSTAYYNKANQIVIGQVYYIKEKERTLVQMSDGRVFLEDELEDVMDELAAAGITEQRRRKRRDNIVYSRLFDGSGWLGEEQETVFSIIPVVATYGNYKVFENKRLYRGVVEKLLDVQRVFNYTKSREVEEVALAPRAKYWMTPTQAAGFEDTIKTMNTNADPVQFFNVDPENPGVPQQNGGAQVNQGLSLVGESMRQMIGQVGGQFAASMGDNPGLQSGVAIEKLQDRGDVMSYVYQEAQEIAIAHTAKILIDAIPKVYDTQRQIQILGSDGTDEVMTVNQLVFDQQTGTTVTLNDLSRGKYSVVCDAGPSFKSRQAETVTAMLEIGQVDPSVIEMGGDILFKNLPAPGMDTIAERKRSQLFQAGLIPQEQMTEEELQQMQMAQQQPQEPDPATMIAQAEIGKAEAQTRKVMVDAEVASGKLQLQQREQLAKEQQANNKHELEALSLMLKKQEMTNERRQQETENMMAILMRQDEKQKMIIEALNTNANTLKTLREAMGVDAIVGDGNMKAYAQQAEIVQDQQSDIE